MKGIIKNLANSNSKFKGQGRVLGSSSSSNPNPNPSIIPNPNPSIIPNPNPYSNNSNSTSNSSTSRQSSNPVPKFSCPICSSPFQSETEVSTHIDLCLTSTKEPTDLEKFVTLYLSNQPKKDSVEILLKLLTNVVKDSGSEKFRRIRMGNAKIKEAVGDVGGGVELLESVGFDFKEEEGEVWGVMDVPNADRLKVIKEAISLLERFKGEGLKENVVEESRAVERKEIDRKVRVFFSVPESVAANIDLPDSFYNLSMDEIKREADSRKKKMAESQLLIPKSFKEKQAASARKKYKLTAIRIQFPDGIVLQGIFLPTEPTTALYEFVSSSLKEPSLEFELLSPAVAKPRVIPRFTLVGDKRPPTLEEERLVPSALVKFKPIETDSIVFTGLNNQLLESSEPLTSNTTVL